jgi:hypothetical protein
MENFFNINLASLNFILFKYENGMNIVAPLKHGTRWLEEKTNPSSMTEYPLDNFTSNFEYVFNENTYWIYRNPIDYLMSALKTEIRTSIEYEEDRTDYIVESFILGKGHHWSSNSYLVMYYYWKNNNIKPIHLSDISNLFSPDIEFIKGEYEMNTYEKTKYQDDLFITNKIGKIRMKMLYDKMNQDSIWLDRILNQDYSWDTSIILDVQNDTPQESKLHKITKTLI